MKVIIVGAGLGGLSAAVCFARRGHSVDLFERSPQLSPKGGGINIRPGASRIMHSWGLEEDLAAISERTPSVILRDLRTGDVAMRNIAVDVSKHADWGTTRKAVINMLYEKACEAGARVHFGTTVVDVADDAEKASVILKDGARIVGDIVIAADGVKSRIRPLILADLDKSIPMEPIVDKTTFYGCEVSASQLSDDPSSLRLMDNVCINTWMGNDGFVVTRYAPKLNQVGFLFGIHSETDQKNLWDENGDIEHVRKFFEGSCSELTKALQLTDTCDRWRLVEMPDLPRWSSKAGRIVLLGDSAHAMHPNAAQGFSTTVEDIGVLEYLLTRPASDRSASMSRPIGDWEAIRKLRVDRIKEYAKWNTRMFSGDRVVPSKDNDRRTLKNIQDVVPDEKAKFHSSAFVK